MRIVIIGTGNVATVLGRKIITAAHTIVQVYGRAATHARTLAEQLGAAYVTHVEQLDTTADLYIIAVADTAIPAVAASLQLNNKLVVHTAGSVSKEVLKTGSTRYGVLYPLQSMRKEMQQLPGIPLLVDAHDADDLSLLQEFALTLSTQVQVAGDEQRLKLHVAAVVVSNFTNHLYTLAERYCAAEQANFRLLHPLITEVATRLQYLAPREAQTGPAIRHDEPTIEKHLALLEEHGALKELYQWFTKSIQEGAAGVNESSG
jgi:predicted short-subunit dehydrogenase-like oxidoreductase (DUF2520 family)